MGLISHGIALDASPACHQRTGVDVYCSQSSLRYFVEFDCLQLGEDTSWVLGAGQHTGSCQQSRITTLEHDPPTHPLIAMRARGASRTLTAVVTPPARTVSSPGQVSISQTHNRGLCARLVLAVPVRIASDPCHRSAKLVSPHIVRCSRLNTPLQAMDRE